MTDAAATAPRVGKLFIACCLVFLASLLLLIPANTAGLDWGALWGYLDFLLFVYVSLPLHAVSLILVLFFGWKYSAWARYGWFGVYLVAYFAIHLAFLGPVFYQPATGFLGELAYNVTHRKDVALINELRINPDAEKVRSLIRSGADVNSPDRYIGFTPLMWAATAGRVEVMTILLDAGADPAFVDVDLKGSLGFRNSATVTGIGALTLAAWAGNDDGRHQSVTLLLERGVEPDVGSVLGSCFHGDIDLLQAQIERGADIDAGDGNDSTCMHQAAIGDQPEMIGYLLERGVDTGARTTYGLTALDTAIREWKDKAVLRLMQAGLRTERPDSLERYLLRSADSPEKDAIRRILAGDLP